MANLTSTAPLAFNTFYGYLVTAGASQNPVVSVMNTELVQFEPGSYVLLNGIENHRWKWAALGSFAFYEWYDIVGYCTVLQGDVDPGTVLTNTYALFEDVVHTTAVTYRAPPLSTTLQSMGLLEFLPGFARYEGEPGSFGGGQGGFMGRVDFSYSCYARVEV